MIKNLKEKAILALYDNVASIRNDESSGGSCVAYDEQENIISTVDADIAAKMTEIEADEKLDQVREERNKRLSETDHWMFSDTATATQAQLDYRQALRDITNTYTSLDTVVWPTKP